MYKTLRYRPIIPLLIFLILGITAGEKMEGFLFPVLAVALFATSIMLRAIIRKKKLSIAPFILFFCLGYISIQPWEAPSISDQHVLNFARPIKWKITGIVESGPVAIRSDRMSLVIRVKRLEDKKGAFRAHGRLRVTCRGKIAAECRSGDRVQFYGKIREIRNFQNPGGFDYERYMAHRAILAASYASEKNFSLIHEKRASSFLNWIEGARKKISEKIEESCPDDSSADVLKALIIGDRNAIEKPLREAFNTVGMGHLLAISGLHVGIVAAFFFVITSRFLSHSRLFLDKAWVFKGSALVCFGPVIFYGFIAGMSPSTQRAVIMATVFLSAFLIDRENDTINTLATAAMLIIILHPPALFSISFQLSFTAVASILCGFTVISRLNCFEIEGSKFFPLKKMAGFFFASVFAILGSLPLVMHYFNQVSLIGVAMNFILVPLVGFIAIPTGLMSAFVVPIFEPLANVGFHFAGLVLSLSIFILRFFADLPYAAVKTVTPSLFEILLYYLLAGFVFLHFRNRFGKERPIENAKIKTADHFSLAAKAKKLRKRKSLNDISPLEKTADLLFEEQKMRKRRLIILVAFAAVASADLTYWCFNRLFRDDLSVTIVDVGQGNAAIVEFPGGKTALIDGGGFYDNSIFDVGERILAPLLWRKKIMGVDTLFLTHPNSDHLNGLLYIAKNFNVKTIQTNGEPSQTKGYQKLMKIIQEEKIEMPPFSEIIGDHDYEGVRVEILYPPPDFIERKEMEQWRDENSNSMVLRFEIGNFSCLFTGDITSDSEKELVRMHGAALKSKILIAPHHGSRTSSSEFFLEAVDPETVIFCTGWRNRFGFPAEEVVDRYKNRGVEIFRTDQNGALRIHTDGESTQILPFID